MPRKKTSKNPKFNLDSTQALLEKVKFSLDNEKPLNSEYREIRSKLINQAISTIKSNKHIENCKQQLVENLRYLGDFKIKNGMPQGRSVTLIDEKSRLFYNGPIVNGVPNTAPGETGISIEANGSIYLGEWHHGEAVGKGVLVDTFENIFVGDFIQGQLEGAGKELLSNGLVLEGTFTVITENGKEISQLNGKGRLTVPDGYSFEGKWKNGVRDGSGIERFPEGYVCVGDWKDDHFQIGIIRYVDGTIEEGDFNENYELEGSGLRIFPNGMKVKNLDGGVWRDGRLFGEGEVVFPDEHEIKNFAGEFENTAPCGHGVLTFKNGITQEGHLVDGKFGGRVKIYVPKSYEYDGELKAIDLPAFDSTGFLQGNLVPHGRGKITFVSGSYYDGEWQSGVPHGKGELFYPKKFHYVGEFKNGKFDGKGSLKSLGTKYSFEGTFKEGKKHGKGKEVLSNNVVLEGTFDSDEAISIKSLNFNGLFNGPFDIDFE